MPKYNLITPIVTINRQNSKQVRADFLSTRSDILLVTWAFVICLISMPSVLEPEASGFRHTYQVNLSHPRYINTWSSVNAGGFFKPRNEIGFLKNNFHCVIVILSIKALQWSCLMSGVFLFSVYSEFY